MSCKKFFYRWDHGLCSQCGEDHGPDLTRALEESQAREAALRSELEGLRGCYNSLLGNKRSITKEWASMRAERDALRAQLAKRDEVIRTYEETGSELSTTLAESQGMVATLREALEDADDALRQVQVDMNAPYFKGRLERAMEAADRAARESQARIQTALSSTADAAKANNERMRREALEEAAKWMNDGGWLDVFPDDDGHPVEVPAGDAMLRALARDGKP